MDVLQVCIDNDVPDLIHEHLVAAIILSHKHRVLFLDIIIVVNQVVEQINDFLLKSHVESSIHVAVTEEIAQK